MIRWFGYGLMAAAGFFAGIVLIHEGCVLLDDA